MQIRKNIDPAGFINDMNDIMADLGTTGDRKVDIAQAAILYGAAYYGVKRVDEKDLIKIANLFSNAYIASHMICEFPLAIEDIEANNEP